MMKEQVAVGLDVGNRHINMVELSREAAGVRLLDYARVSLNPRAGRGEQLRQLEHIAREKGIMNLPVNIGVSGESVIVRYIDLPRMSKQELAQALKYEAQQYIPFKMEEVIFDFHILEPESSVREKMKVLLVAAKRQAIMEFVRLIQEIGLKPNLIDVNSFSLINCFLANGPQREAGQICALINLEFDLVNINILQGDVPYFTRDISLLEDVLSLREEKIAEIGLFATMRPLLANLIREIRLSLDYYESEFEQQVTIIYLSGEGARDRELINFFSNQLGVELSLWNPLQNLLIDSQQARLAEVTAVSPMLALACGLALRGVK